MNSVTYIIVCDNTNSWTYESLKKDLESNHDFHIFLISEKYNKDNKTKIYKCSVTDLQDRSLFILYIYNNCIKICPYGNYTRSILCPTSLSREIGWIDLLRGLRNLDKLKVWKEYMKNWAAILKVDKFYIVGDEYSYFYDFWNNIYRTGKVSNYSKAVIDIDKYLAEKNNTSPIVYKIIGVNNVETSSN